MLDFFSFGATSRISKPEFWADLDNYLINPNFL